MAKIKTSAADIKRAYDKHQDKLTKREKDIVERYYAFNNHVRHTLQEIGNGYGITRERVRQIKFVALIKLGVAK